MNQACIRVASVRDFDSATVVEFSTGQGDWPMRGFVLQVGEAFCAYINRCPHAGHALNLSPGAFFDRSGNYLICSSHGAMFEPGTGVCVAGPCPGETLAPLECEVVGDDLYIRTP